MNKLQIRNKEIAYTVNAVASLEMSGINNVYRTKFIRVLSKLNEAYLSELESLEDEEDIKLLDEEFSNVDVNQNRLMLTKVFEGMINSPTLLSGQEASNITVIIEGLESALEVE